MEGERASATDPTQGGKRQLKSAAFEAKTPSLSLPKAGGAIRGIGEKFSANPVTGTGSASIPIPTSPGRGGLNPQLSLAYSSGAGNGAFGLGWSLSMASITRRTDKRLPCYADDEENDVFILHEMEDLVPYLVHDGSDSSGSRRLGRSSHGRRSYLCCASLPAACRGKLRPHRTLDQPGRSHRSLLAEHLSRQRDDLVWAKLRKPRQRSGRSDADLFVARMRNARRQGQRIGLSIQGRGFLRNRPDAAE